MRAIEFVGAMVAAAFWLIATPAWSQESAGRIEKASGSVSVLYGLQSRPAQVGMQLQVGARIITGFGSYAEIRLLDETVLALGPDCRVRISRFQFDPATHVGRILLTVIKGALRVTTGLIGQKSPEAVRFRTIIGTIGIRGTQFIVEAGDRN